MSPPARRYGVRRLRRRLGFRLPVRVRSKVASQPPQSIALREALPVPFDEDSLVEAIRDKTEVRCLL